MNRMKYSNIPEALQNKIIAAAYGDASLKDKFSVLLAARKNKEIKNMFDEFKRTASTVRNLKIDECPIELSEIIKSKTGVKGEKPKGVFSDLIMIFVSKPVASMAVTGLAILLIVTVLIVRPNDYYNDYSQQELTLAELQTKESLLIVSKIFNQTKNTIEEDVLTSRVAKPIQEGINYVNKILTEGEVK